MRYNRLGRAGLKVSELSFGSWVTFGDQLDLEGAKACMRQAFELGVNFFDNAEVYADGLAESIMGIALEEYRREDLVVSTKIFWGGKGPNDRGLSWKHLVEGTHASLRRLQLEYVDLLFCHRPDEEVPVEETVRAMDHLVRSGRAFYWGTSEWSAEQIEGAQRAARELGCIPPVVEQPEYNLFHRRRVEKEYAPLYEKHGLGTTIWSPLASGVLTGKYNDGIPAGSRLERVEWLRKVCTPERIEKVRRLSVLARELDCSMAQLALAWCLTNPDVSTVITGATSEAQVRENLGAAEVRERLTPEVLADIDAIVGPECD
jgi:voltage-dependent potassium channel beta subunit